MPVNTTAPAIIIYYTDQHDVDEDMRTIPIHGGRWIGDEGSGVFDRAMDDAPDHDTYIVASRKKITGLTHLSVMPVYFIRFE